MGLDFIDASSAFPFERRLINRGDAESATTWNYWRIPQTGNAGGLYHAEFLTINKLKKSKVTKTALLRHYVVRAG